MTPIKSLHPLITLLKKKLMLITFRSYWNKGPTKGIIFIKRKHTVSRIL